MAQARGRIANPNERIPPKVGPDGRRRPKRAPPPKQKIARQLCEKNQAVKIEGLPGNIFYTNSYFTPVLPQLF